MTISKSKHVPIRWNGEDQRGMRLAGTYGGVLQNQFAQAFRTLTNLIEVDLFNIAYKAASRAAGTAGTTPFSTAANLSDAANVRRVLDDNGAPQSDLHLVLGSAAVANLRGNQTIPLKSNENGSDAFRRGGIISEVPLAGFTLHNSNAIAPVAGGAGSAYVTSGSTAAGANSITLATGTGTVLAGDVVKFAVGADQYVVNAGVSAPGAITIGNPGARIIIPTANAMTIAGAYTPNVAFARNALQLITRLPAMPLGPNGESMDLAEDLVVVTDPISGLSFEIVAYRQFRQFVFHVAIAWGVANIKSEHVALPMG
jgi:P22 coat protein - gene protein 5